MSKTIFITGASKGFGRIWTEALLKRGDKVVATARTLSLLEDLKTTYGENVHTIQLDVTDRDAVFAAAQEAKDHFGKIDVVINNAGFGLFGAVEETTEQQARDQFEPNFFGLLWVTQAFIPVMREQGGGHIIQISSILGVVTFPTLGLYNASKFAVEGLTESLAPEVAQFGIKLTLLEPNAYQTDWIGAHAVHTEANPLYNKVKEDLYASFGDDFFGKPEATADLVLKVVDSENPPLRIFVGKQCYPFAKAVYEQKWAVWDEWAQTANEAHGV